MQLASDPAAPQARTLPANTKPGGGYETNYHQIQANQSREEYARTYAIAQAVSQANIEGFLDITVRTSSGSITLPFVGEGAAGRAKELFVTMMELLGDKLNSLESDIVHAEQMSEQDEAADREGTSERAQLFAFCLPMRPLSDTEFEAMPPEARRMYDEHRVEGLSQSVKGGATL